MIGSRGKRPPLVADKRSSGGKKARQPAEKPAPKSSRRRRTAAPRRKLHPLIGWPLALIGWVVGLVFRLTWRAGVIAALILGLAVGYFALTMPPASALLDARTRGSVTMLDRDGEVFAWRGEQFGGQITADTVSPNLRNAIIATEDRRFYRHFGVSPRGVASAVRINLSEGRGPLSGHGGSTITQQTAKLLCLGVPYDPASGMTEAEYEADCRRSTMQRKLKEAVYALAMELRYSKDEILTIYLNRAYLGAGTRGFEAAAQRYFGKSANEVNPSEAAMLAGLLVAPSRFAPTADLQRSQDRARLIIGLMEEQGFLTTAEADQARANPAQLSAAAEARAGGYFADWVMDVGPAFLTSETTEDVIIRTTFDQRIQTAAEDALQYIFENKVREGSQAQAAIVVMSADGAVRAMVGGRKFRGVAGQFNRAIQAKRQTGSAFKPFVYAAALDLGWSPNDIILDGPLTINIPGSGPWSPRNYTNDFYGPVTLTEALARSLNTTAVRLSEEVGRDNVRAVAEAFGIRSDLAQGPALALGASESTLLEMTGAYAGILNGGSAVAPYGLIEIRLQGETDPILGQEGGIQERVIRQEAAEQLVYMMSEVMTRGSGTRAALPDRPSAGKTGTTQAARDAWFLGFTADYVAGVWMGYDDNTPLTGVTGSGLPAEIWHETMVRVHEGLPVRPLPMRAPEPPTRVAQREPQRSAPATGTGNAADQIIMDVLNAIFGAR
ncbi:transglycosylase domain-containing protein [Palleronia sp. KMU-117]|uniref:transglycosylase domain-containing protein n=1 Tax=Palleronia sp. KMU-117 TaxID=3434108 RepID=UPI003D75AFDD